MSSAARDAGCPANDIVNPSDRAATTVWATLNWYTMWLQCERQASSEADLADWLEQTMAALLLP